MCGAWRSDITLLVDSIENMNMNVLLVIVIPLFLALFLLWMERLESIVLRPQHRSDES